MRTSIFSSNCFGLAVTAAALGWTTPASATECPEECPKGFTCELSESVVCADTPTCPEGERCEEASDCDVVEFAGCVSIDCSADSDCADGMVCATVQHERCSTSGGAPVPDPGGDPDPDADAVPPDAPPEDSCEIEERNYCMPQYLLPCEVAADCGPGFTCEAREECSCSSPPSPGSDGGGSEPDGGEDDAGDAERPASPLPEDEDGVDGCECEPGPVACQLVVTECAADSDCPSGMSCEDNPEGVCSSTPDGAEECTADPEKLCLPLYVEYFNNGGVIEEQASGPGSNPDAASGEPPRGSSGEGDDDTNGADASSNESSSSGGGCAVGTRGAPMGAWASLGLVLGAALLGRRRRSAR